MLLYQPVITAGSNAFALTPVDGNTVIFVSLPCHVDESVVDEECLEQLASHELASILREHGSSLSADCIGNTR